MEYLGEVPAGASALLVAGLAIRKEATGDTRYDRVLRRLGRFLVGQTEPTGAVLASYDLDARRAGRPASTRSTTRVRPIGRSRCCTELSRTRVGARPPTASAATWRPPATRSRTTGRRCPTTGPPTAQAETVEFPERAAAPLTDAEVAYARRQAELFGSATRWVSQQAGPWGEVVRGGDTPRGGGYGVISEALTGWWLVAQREPGMANLEGAIAERASCIAGLTVDAQSDGDEAASAASPERVEGAWVVDGETRMDDQQHALAGLLRTVPIVEAQRGFRARPIRATTRPRAGCGPSP